MNATTRECPFCLEKIDITEITCSYCNNSMEGFNNKIAIKTNWAPIKGNDFSVVEQELNEISKTRIEFLATKSIKSMEFMIIGASLISLILAIIITLSDIKDSPAFIFWGFGVFALVFGLFMLKAKLTPRVFDLEQKHYYKGSKYELAKEKCDIIDIVAIQVLSEFISADNLISESNIKRKDSYKYEINLILKDAQRINLVESSNLQKIREDAKKLSEFLNIPLLEVIKKIK